LDRNRRRYRLCCRRTHQVMASHEEWWCELEKQIASDTELIVRFWHKCFKIKE
jgi:hypothetical protein